MSIVFKTYLTPSIPKEIFIILAEYLQKQCEIKVNLIFETTSSGPKKGEMIKEDLAFMCTPPYYWLKESFNNSIELVPYAPVFEDSRNKNLPLYFSDILVHRDNVEIKSLNDLNQHIWAYNDTESLSGYFCIKNQMSDLKLICSGSHLNSIQMVQNKKADITCIDSNVLLYNKHDLKHIGTFGPHPVQPCIIRSDCKYKNKIIKAFENINKSNIIFKLNKLKILGFKKVDEDFYFNKYSINNLLI